MEVQALERLNSLLSQIAGNLTELSRRMDLIEGKLANHPIDTAEACQLLGVTRTTLQKFRESWIAGVHYFPQGEQRRVLYNRELLIDWQQNRLNATAHQAAVEQWLRKQPSNQRKRKS